jgi:hypothetical protein
MRVCPCTALFLKRGGAGFSVSEAVLITAPFVAEMVTVVEAATAPFLPTCHARADLGSATPCVMCAICSSLEQWRLPSGAISRIIIYIVAQAKVFFSCQGCRNWQSSARYDQSSVIVSDDYRNRLAVTVYKLTRRQRSLYHMLTVTRNWPSGMRRQWPTYLPRSTSRVPGLMGTCTL